MSSRQTPSQTPLREQHAEVTRERLLDAAVRLVERGRDVTMRAVAAEAQVGERTVYRYYPSLDDLLEAMRPRFVGRAGVPLCETIDGLEQYARDLFGVFDQNANLVEAMLSGPLAGDLARRSRRANLEMMRKLIDDAFPRAPASERAAATSTLRAVLSGAGWSYLRRSCELPQEDVVAHAQWMVRTVLDRLGRASR